MRKKLRTLLFALVAIVIHADTFDVGTLKHSTLSNTLLLKKLKNLFAPPVGPGMPRPYNRHNI